MKHKLFCIIGPFLLCSASSFAQTPVLPYKDVGACPFECCTYRQWIVNEDTLIYREMSDTSPIAFIVRRREKVTGITGVVITTEAGQVKALRDKKLEHISVKAGDVLYTLTYLGEGYYKVWYKGEITTEAFYEEPAMKVLRSPEAIWWVKIKNRKGQVGWTKLPENFDNKDACGETSDEQSNDANDSPIKTELLALEKQVSKAILKGDKALFERLLAKRFTYTNFGNPKVKTKPIVRWDRATFLSKVSPRAFFIRYQKCGEYKLSFEGGVAVITSGCVDEFREGSVIVVDFQQATYRWVKQYGKWRLLSLEILDTPPVSP